MHTTGSAAMDTVLNWHDALNQGDVDRLLSLSSQDVEVGGPRGTSRGSNLLAEWVARAHIRLEPGRVFIRGNTLVVEQNASWRAEDGSLSEPQHVASAFRVDRHKVTSVIRYPDVSSALQAAGLDPSDAAPSCGSLLT